MSNAIETIDTLIELFTIAWSFDLWLETYTRMRERAERKGD